MEDNLDRVTIGTLAKMARVNVETIRFYQRKGLLRAPEKPYGGVRRYGRSDIERLRFVKTAQRLGFSLDEVAQLLKLQDGAHCSEAADIAARRLLDVRSRLAELSRMESLLSELISRCRTQKGKISCPLIASLYDEH